MSFNSEIYQKTVNRKEIEVKQEYYEQLDKRFKEDFIKKFGITCAEADKIMLPRDLHIKRMAIYWSFWNNKIVIITNKNICGYLLAHNYACDLNKQSIQDKCVEQKVWEDVVLHIHIHKDGLKLI